MKKTTPGKTGKASATGGKKAAGKSAPAREDASGSVVDMAVERIRQRITRGQFAPGQRLIEPNLAEMIQVSRTALREAFRRLAAEGLLEIELYKGATVRRVEKKDIRETFMIRELLEGLVARMAAPAFQDPANRKKLLEVRDELRRTAKGNDGGEAYTLANVKFHQLLSTVAGSETLTRFIEQLHLPLYRLVYARMLVEKHRSKSMDQHEKIIEALLEGDAKKAETAMKRHITQSGEAITSLPDDFFS